MDPQPRRSARLWVKSVPDKEKDRTVSVLMITDLASGKHRKLTVGRSSISSARISPEGRRVSFLSSRSFPDGMKGLPKEKAGNQIWVLDLAGGEARPLTKVPFGVGAYQWIDEKIIVLSARERLSRSEAIEKERKDDTVVVEDSRRFFDAARRLFRFELESKKLVRLTNNEDQLSSFSVSDDGRWAVASHARSPSFQAENDLPPRCFVHDLKTGAATEIFAGQRNRPRGFFWRHDSTGFFALYPVSTVDGEASGSISTVREVDVSSFAVQEVRIDHDFGVTGSLAVCEDGFIVGLCNGARPELARYQRANGSWKKTVFAGDTAKGISYLIKARDSKRVLYVTGGASDPDHVMTAEVDGSRLDDPKEILRPNGGFAKKRIAKTEIIRWVGALDEEVEGILYYPHDYKKGVKHPLVLITHGGPHGADRDRFTERYANSPNLYAQRGAFVLKTNYHGSSDYGLDFGESIKHRYYELEIQDMFAGIEKLVAGGLVDPEQMGLVGWSNGAILSVAALTLNHLYAPRWDWKFKACAPGAGDVNWTSDYGNCAFGARFDDYYLGGAPWEKPDLYLRKSPLFHVERVTTPTIIFHGSQDTAVPTEQGWEWYRALHKVGKAPVRFLLFPGQPHGLRKLSHQRRKLEEELAWFDRYLFVGKDGEVPLVKKGSPLDVAIKRASFARYGRDWGVVSKNILVPETIPFGDIEVARFEVTRAQWAFFEPAARDLMHSNYPAAEITPGRARAYVAWLRENTKEDWRLLTAAEHEKLRSSAGPLENTLDRWAGYKPVSKDAAALSGLLRALDWRVVLQPVGSTAPGRVGQGGAKELVFDLGGNVAELVRGEDGKLVPRGGCAVMSPDDRDPSQNTPPAYVGLRLAKGPSPRKE